MTTIPQLAEVLQRLLSSTADQIAGETGFVQRRSKMSGALFCQTLVFGWLAKATASLTELVQTAATAGVGITPQGLEERFSARAAEFMRHLLEEALGKVVAAHPVAVPILQRFAGVYIQDSTNIPLPDSLVGVWHGSGERRTNQTVAGLKAQVQLDYSTGSLNQVILQDGRAQDRNAPIQQTALPAGALRLADLGYFSLPVLADLSAQGVYWLSRLQANTIVLTLAGERLNLLAWLRQAGTSDIDQRVLVGNEHRLHCRLIVKKVPQEVADRRRQQLHKQARRKNQAVSQVRLALADWTILITNVPEEQLTVHEALVLARCRWQIELLFKLWKSYGHLDESRSTQPWRVLTEVYAKLLAMVVQHWLILVSCWSTLNRSLFKAAQTISSHALHLLSHFSNLDQLAQAIKIVHQCLLLGCRINKRKTAPHTYQLLLEPDRVAA
jgi:Transposase DDE domain